jgi:septal ring factor EnvC (AmiA/AmiB activator)
LIRHLALAVLWCCLAAAVPAAAETRAEREKAKLEALRDKRSALEQQVKQAESSRSAAADELRDTEKAISASGRKLRSLGEERAAARDELTGHEGELRQLERQAATRQAQLARLLRHQFRPNEADALAVLLAGGDPNVAARDRHFLALLSRAKADLIAGLKRDAAETRRLTEVVRERSEKLADLVHREEQERANLRQRQQERQVVLAKISKQIKEQRREIDTLKHNESRLANLIESLAKRPVRSKPAKPARSGKGSELPLAQTVTAEPDNPTGAFARLRGKLIRPAAGAVAGRFGARRDDGQSVWKGLFIRAAEGADVRAVAPGVVVFADWLRGYGNLLIIDHDDDFLSVYGNNQSLLADVGQKVGAGKAVATVGASGGQPESGLYFELRHRGRAFDPLKWLEAP